MTEALDTWPSRRYPRPSPGIVHLGAGAFHRSHQAVYLDDLLQRGRAADWGVVGVGTTPGDRALHSALVAQDLRWTVETRRPDGSSEHRVVDAMVEHVVAPDDPATVLARLVDPRIRVVTLTITEGGYPVDRDRMELRPDARLEDDMRRDLPSTSTGLLVQALAVRHAAGIAPFSVVSCDNLPHNGRVARAAVVGGASLVDRDLVSWIEDEVDFPSSMVDRITPATTPADVARVRDDAGHADACPVVAEPFRQWVLEGGVRGSIPPLEEVGVQMVSDVAPFETLKLRVLNGGHQAVAWPALLLGHELVHHAAGDPDVAAFVRGYWTHEVLPSLPSVPGTDVAAYAATALERFSHPYLPDTVERLAAHSGDRMPQFVLDGTAESVAAGRPVPRAALLVASWWRSLCAAAAGDGRSVTAPPPVRPDDGLGAFLAGPHLGTLAGNPAFARQVVTADQSIARSGIRSALRSTGSPS